MFATPCPSRGANEQRDVRLPKSHGQSRRILPQIGVSDGILNGIAGRGKIPLKSILEMLIGSILLEFPPVLGAPAQNAIHQNSPPPFSHFSAFCTSNGSSKNISGPPARVARLQRVFERSRASKCRFYQKNPSGALEPFLGWNTGIFPCSPQDAPSDIYIIQQKNKYIYNDNHFLSI